MSLGHIGELVNLVTLSRSQQSRLVFPFIFDRLRWVQRSSNNHPATKASFKKRRLLICVTLAVLVPIGTSPVGLSDDWCARKRVT